MKKSDFNKISEEYSPLKGKSRKIWNWKYIVGLIIVLTVVYTVKNYRESRSTEVLNEHLNAAKSSIEELTPQELKKYNDLREKIIAIPGKYLNEREYKDFLKIIYKASRSGINSEELKKGNYYFNKVRSKCSPEEKKTLEKWNKLVQRLSRIKNDK